MWLRTQRSHLAPGKQSDNEPGATDTFVAGGRVHSQDADTGTDIDHQVWIRSAKIKRHLHVGVTAVKATRLHLAVTSQGAVCTVQRQMQPVDLRMAIFMDARAIRQTT